MQYVCVCAFIVMELLRITRQIHCKAVEQIATLIHRQYNRDWGTSYSRPRIDPYLTSTPLQDPGGATDDCQYSWVQFLTGRRPMRSFSPVGVATIAVWKWAPIVE